MRGGRERNILRWEAHMTLHRNRLRAVEDEIAELESATPDVDRARLAQLQAERISIMRAMDALGPNPSGKMG